MLNRKGVWDIREVRFLEDSYKAGDTVETIAKALKRSLSAVKSKIGYMMLTRPVGKAVCNKRSWTAEQDAILKQGWKDGTPRRVICEALGRSKSSVTKRASLLGLKRPAEALTQVRRDAHLVRQAEHQTWLSGGVS